MFREYALEPAVLSSWDRTRFFLDAFGPWKGRFLAEYPRHWKRMVFEGLRCPDVEKKRITERLRQLDKRIFSARSNAVYDGARTWLDNAMSEHQRMHFDAIIVTITQELPHILDGAEVDDRNELWRVESGALVTREPAAVVSALRHLLAASRRIVLIDPYFRADQDEKTRPLVAFCQAANSIGATVEVHFSDETRGHDLCMRDATRALPQILPSGVEVTLHCWNQRAGGPRLHNRYLITEIGGVQFGDGIELGEQGEWDRLSILDQPSWIRCWNDYLAASPAFDRVGTPQTFRGR